MYFLNQPLLERYFTKGVTSLHFIFNCEFLKTTDNYLMKFLYKSFYYFLLFSSFKNVLVYLYQIKWEKNSCRTITNAI